MSSQRPTLVLGIGNILMGDEGVGVHTVRALEQEKLPDSVTVVDGGTGGFHLLSYFQDYSPIILIDATMDGKPAGTVNVLHPRFASDYPRTLTAHDIGLRDLIESAVLIGPMPPVTLITVTIAEIKSMTLEMSPAVQAAIPKVAELVREILINGKASPVPA